MKEVKEKNKKKSRMKGVKKNRKKSRMKERERDFIPNRGDGVLEYITYKSDHEARFPRLSWL